MLSSSTEILFIFGLIKELIDFFIRKAETPEDREALLKIKGEMDLREAELEERWKKVVGEGGS